MNEKLFFKVENFEGEDIIVNGVFVDDKGISFACVDGKKPFRFKNLRYNTGVRDKNNNIIFEEDELISNDKSNDYCKGKVKFIDGSYYIDTGEKLIGLFSEIDKFEFNVKDQKDTIIKNLEKEIIKLKYKLSNYENETIEYNGSFYSKVDRLAKEGDLIVYPKCHNYWSSTIINKKPYLVVEKNSILYFRDSENVISRVYGSYKGYDDEESVLVYEKCEDVE